MDMLKAAAEQFLDKSISQIQNIALETLVCFVCFLIEQMCERLLKSCLCLISRKDINVLSWEQCQLRYSMCLFCLLAPVYNLQQSNSTA